MQRVQRQQRGIESIGGKDTELPPPTLPRQKSAEVVAVADVSLIHHQKGSRFGKPPNNLRKIGLFDTFFADHFLKYTGTTCRAPTRHFELGTVFRRIIGI
jgi:hypothetical protein